MIAGIVGAITLIVAAIAVYTDVRWGKIFNAVTVPAMGVGLTLNAVADGPAGLLMSVSGIALGLGLFLFSALLGRILGGGDIKLLLAVGALQGPTFLLWTVAAAAGIGAVLAIAISLYNGILISKLKSLVASCYLRAACKVPMRIEHDAGGPRLPYAIAIALGTAVSMTIAKL